MVPPWTQPPSCCESHISYWMVFYLVSLYCICFYFACFVFLFFWFILCPFYFFFMENRAQDAISCIFQRWGCMCKYDCYLAILHQFFSLSTFLLEHSCTLYILYVINSRLSTSERLLLQQSLGQPLKVWQKRGGKVRICINFEKSDILA